MTANVSSPSRRTATRSARPFLDELTAFPHARHDDCVDALSGAHTYLARRGRPATIRATTAQIPNPLPTRDSLLFDIGHDALDSIAAMIGARVYPGRPR